MENKQIYSVSFRMPEMKETDVAVLNYIFNPNISFGLEIKEDKEKPLIDEEDTSEEVMRAKEIELVGIKVAEEGHFEEAILTFTQSIEVCERASGYNNRAQAYRLLGDDTSALEDLDTALMLCNGKGKAGCQALCQRGILYRKLGDDDKARADFKLAAELGSQFAKKQLVEMNPYAAMCNQMLHQMMSKFNTFEDDS